MSLISELKRRKVFKVGAAYLVVGWLVIEVAATVMPQFNVPDWAPRLVTLLIALGLPIALVMAWVFDVTPEGLKVDAARAGSKRLIGAALIMVALTLGWYFHGVGGVQPGSGTPGSPVEGDDPADPHGRKSAVDSPTSIAVLPFVDMSQAKDQEYFSDGLSEELLNLLAQLPQLRVIARTSSFSFKGKEADVATIAKALDVANVLEGSVRKSGNTLRITAQLIRASDSSHLWSQTFDREMTDIFRVQDEIAGAVVEALKVRLLPSQALVNPNRSSNTEAYNQFLLANQFFGGVSEGYPQAVTAFKRAIALDPGYAAAYAGLSRIEEILGDRTGDESTKRQALADAEKAIALAPDLADAYVARGLIRLGLRMDKALVRADFEKALALNPNFGRALTAYARLLISMGQIPEAMTELRKATNLDPVASGGWVQMGRLLNYQAEYESAHAALAQALEAAPGSEYARFHLGSNSLLQGKNQEALEIFRDAGREYGQAGVAMAEYSLGHEDKSKQTLETLIGTSAQGAAYQIAEVHAWRGEADKAFEWLDRAYAQNDGGLNFIKVDPLLARVKADPRFAALLKRMGLPE
jgi:adenylate cyclase